MRTIDYLQQVLTSDMTAQEISKITGQSVYATKKMLRVLVNKGIVERISTDHGTLYRNSKCTSC